MLVTIASYKIQDWRKQTTNLEMRVTPNDTYIADNDAAGLLLEAETVYRKVAVSVATETIDGYSSPVLTLPAVTLYSTSDAIVNRLATLRLTINDTRTGKVIHAFESLQAFILTDTTPTNWTDIIFSNSVIPNYQRPNFDQELKNYSDYAFLNKISGGAVLADVTSTPASTPATNTSLVNKSYITAQRGVVNSALIADFPLTSDYTGALYKALDGNQDIYNWTGTMWNPLNGGKFLATNFEFVNDGLSATPTDNLSMWEALIAAVPATGAIVEFPPGDYYFSEHLETTKSVFIIGAGAGYTPDGEPIAGTNIIVESGQSGFKALSPARKVSIEKMSFSTSDGYGVFSTGDGIYSDVPIVIKDVYIQSFGRDGIYLEGSGASNTDFSLLERVDVWGVKRDGFHYNGGGDTNVVTTKNCNATYNGRHGFYSAGYSNVYENVHVAFSAIVTVGGKDYYEAGRSNIWTSPYSESGTGSNYFYIADAANFCKVETVQFGEPEIQYQSAGASLSGHIVNTSAGLNRLILEDAQQTANSHTYEWRVSNINAANALNLIATTYLGVQTIPYEYRPGTTRHYLTGSVNLVDYAAVTSGAVIASAGTLVVAKHNMAGTVPPSSSNNFAAGYNLTSRWYDTVAGDLYECVGDGVWFQF